ncbi:MAG: Rieske 2Fe-2S domain-containing protein [Nevskia sp.]|nr:Rieske 2Fe-2S domain-containing protein [Nevskia sp.]
MTLHRLECAEPLKPGDIRPVQVQGRALVLVCGERGPALVDAICPHAGARLAEGEVVGHRLRCPGHRFVFDLDTGDCARGRREGWGPLKVYPLQNVDGQLFVEL